jgi:hypothetical protein
MGMLALEAPERANRKTSSGEGVTTVSTSPAPTKTSGEGIAGPPAK